MFVKKFKRETINLCVHYIEFYSDADVLQKTEVRLFFGAAFISSEDADILFEVKAVFCFDFYVFRDVFKRIPNVHQDCFLQNILSLWDLFWRMPRTSTSLHLGKAEISPRQASCAANGLQSEPAWHGKVRSTKTARGRLPRRNLQSRWSRASASLI